MQTVLTTMRVEQRKDGPGPYHFQRAALNPTDSLVNGVGNPLKPNGLIASAFRPSDDACMLLFFDTRQPFRCDIAAAVGRDVERSFCMMPNMANQASNLADEVEAALQKHALVSTPAGTIWAYEIDGFGGHVLMDDANAPSLLSLPYLESSPDPAVYARTRAFAWSTQNPWFFRGKAGEGIGGPHIGRDSIWPMSQIMYALTSNSNTEIKACDPDVESLGRRHRIHT